MLTRQTANGEDYLRRLQFGASQFGVCAGQWLVGRTYGPAGKHQALFIKYAAESR
jgi:hypothetical protein